MAGILDNKERIIDSIVTLEGRRQVIGGKLKVEFASFSDRYTFYQKFGETDTSPPVEKSSLDRH